MVSAVSEKGPLAKGFVFTFSCALPTTFSFEGRLSSAPAGGRVSCKRRRALSDVDGGLNDAGKKKRRLRLSFVTSRLSRPYSAPATNIVDRGTSKIAVWAKKKPFGTHLLRKAAIMNAARLRLCAADEMERRRSEELCRKSVLLRQLLAPPKRLISPTPQPSPLGLSNYDALDLEEDELWEEDSSGAPPLIYSDFSIRNPVSSDEDAYEYLDELDGIHDLPEERAPPPPPPPDERLVEMVREKERQREICFIYMG